jgi:glucose/mannose transport system permease protein
MNANVVRPAEPLQAASRREPEGPRPKNPWTISRLVLYAALLLAALFFILPLYAMIVTSLKSLDEVRNGAMLALPHSLMIENFVKAWASACTGVTCEGLSPGFWNSVRILIPSVVAAIAFGSITGYALCFWRIPAANVLLVGLILGRFIPLQVFIYPLVIAGSRIGIYGTILAVIVMHAMFELAIMTLLFRNYFSGLPLDLFKAARVDGAGFFKTFFWIILPMSTPIIVVAVILVSTSVWNDFLLGLVFAGHQNYPMTVQLNNMVSSTEAAPEYNVEMAAVLITTLVPILIYILSGRWFVRGIAAGAVKG